MPNFIWTCRVCGKEITPMTALSHYAINHKEMVVYAVPTANDEILIPVKKAPVPVAKPRVEEIEAPAEELDQEELTM